MVFQFVALAVVAVLAGLHALHTYRPSWEYLRHREPTWDRWATQYPPPQLPRVLQVLELLRDSLLLRPDDIYRLEPEDRILAIYKSAYPHGGADSLELEELAGSISDRFGVAPFKLREPALLSVRDIIEACLNAPETTEFTR